MNLDISKEETALLEELLSREFNDLSIQIHHCWAHEYKHFLKEKQNLVEKLLEKLKKAQ
jgi:hypothetical protein